MRYWYSLSEYRNNAIYLNTMYIFMKEWRKRNRNGIWVLFQKEEKAIGERY
jgi:hypothetical protein